MSTLEIDVVNLILGGLGTVATIVMGILVWFVKRMVESFDSLKDEFHNFKKEVAEQYAKKEEVKKDIEHALETLSILIKHNSQQLAALAIELKEERGQMRDYINLLLKKDENPR